MGKRIYGLSEQTSIEDDMWMLLSGSNGDYKIAPKTLQELANMAKMFGCGTEISKNADLNNYTDAGRYYAATSAITNTITNTPYTTGGFELIVSDIGKLNKLQIMITMSDVVRMFARVRIDDSWSRWCTLSGDRLLNGHKVGAFDKTNDLMYKATEVKMTSFVKSDSMTEIAIDLGVTPKKIVQFDFAITNGTYTYTLPYFSYSAGNVGTYLWNVEGSTIKFMNNVDWGSAYTLLIGIWYIPS